MEIIILGVIFLILLFFYKQAICEFRINQMEWSQQPHLLDLLSEKVPLVIRSIPLSACWTHNDVTARECYTALPLFQETTLPQWLAQATPETVCPWKYAQAEQIAAVSGLPVWAKKTLHPSFVSPLWSYWMMPRYHCWAGKVGLRRTYATWTCILPVETEIVVTILPETAESCLPAAWPGCFPHQLTNKDTPFVADLKYMDIIVRPGNCLVMPPHWFVSWSGAEGSKSADGVPSVCTVSYHTPISLLAFHASPSVRRG